MLRLLALPVAVVAALASSGCAAVDDDRTESSPSPDASATQSAGATPGATASGGTGAAEPGDGASVAPSEPSASAAPEARDSTAALEGDPGAPGLPDQGGASVDDVLRLGAVASWTEQPGVIALSLPASSSCWPFVAPPVVESPTRLVVHVQQPQPCDGLDGARTYSIAVPPGVDASADLQLAVVGLEHEFTLELPAR